MAEVSPENARAVRERNESTAGGNWETSAHLKERNSHAPRRSLCSITCARAVTGLRRVPQRRGGFGGGLVPRVAACELALKELGPDGVRDKLGHLRNLPAN